MGGSIHDVTSCRDEMNQSLTKLKLYQQIQVQQALLAS